MQVCPTGIDIRKGLQYECIGCAACIDVCDGVMDKMQYPRGLIRYATQNGMDGRWSRARMLRTVLRPRVLIYTAILWAAIALLAASLYLRAPFRVDVVRDRAALARQVDGGDIENVYRLQLMNATETVQRYDITVDGGSSMEGLRVMPQSGPVELQAIQARWVTLVVRLPADAATVLKPGAHPVHFQIERLPSPREAAPVRVREASSFIVPR